MDGGGTHPEDTQDANNRAYEPIFRKELQQDNVERAPEKHRCGVELACHQEGFVVPYTMSAS